MQIRPDSVVFRASASQSVDLGFIYLVESYQKTLNNGSMLGAQYNRHSVVNKPASSLVMVSLGKTLNRMPPSLCGRQMMGQSSPPIVVTWSN